MVNTVSVNTFMMLRQRLVHVFSNLLKPRVKVNRLIVGFTRKNESF
jgi:hypothetical protein